MGSGSAALPLLPLPLPLRTAAHLYRTHCRATPLACTTTYLFTFLPAYAAPAAYRCALPPLRAAHRTAARALRPPLPLLRRTYARATLLIPHVVLVWVRWFAVLW